MDGLAASLGALCLLALVIAPRTAAAEGLALIVHPTDDPFDARGCAIVIDPPQLRVAEMVGNGLRPLGPWRWFATEAELGAVRDAVKLLAGTTPEDADPLDRSAQASPWVRIVWSLQTEDGIRAGHLDHDGLDLPEPLRRLLGTVIPGSYCERALSPG